MLEAQINYIHYLQKIKSLLTSPELTSLQYDTKTIDSISKQITDCELVVPIIGAFSAGKSSLLNTFLKKNSLPVAITPETSLANELHFSKDERIEAIGDNGQIERFDIKDIPSITQNSVKYKYMKMFINNDKLKDISPFILVDMPGFESPLDIHNKAILEYINKGSHYIVLTSCEDGTMTNSMLRNLEDIKQYKRDFDFFLTKTDLKAPDEIDDIKEQLEEVISVDLDLKKKVHLLSEKGKTSFNVTLKELDPNKLVKNIFNEVLKDNYYDVSETLNTSISTLKRTKSDNEQAIKELNKGLEDILSNRNSMIESAHDRFGNVNVNRIIDTVGAAITNSSDEIVRTGIAGGQEALNTTVSEIIRHSLVSATNDSMEGIKDDIIDSFKSSLTNLSACNSGIELNGDFINKLSSNATSLMGRINEFKGATTNNNNGKAIYKTLSTVLAVTTKVIAPILEIVLIFLPEIISSIASYFQKQKQEQQIREVLITTLIPSVKRSLREKLPEIFGEQVKMMIANISEQFETKIEQKQEDIKKAEEEIKSKVANVEEEIKKFNIALEEINAEANKTLFI